jgi:hypothetical protein
MLIIIFALFSYSCSAYLTQKEAAHVGLSFPEPDIVRAFRSEPLFNNSVARAKNDMMLHHELVENFCLNYLLELYGHRCTWREYYLLLDWLRAPFVTLYDPGMEAGFDIEQSLHPRANRGRPCEEFVADAAAVQGGLPVMDAARFHQYVRASRPFIIRNFSAHYPAVHDGSSAAPRARKRKGGAGAWDLAYLESQTRTQQVVVSASPFGEFDGPEPLSAWGVDTTGADPEDSVLIARPAHVRLPFAEFAEILTNARFARAREQASLYLEYFPLHMLGEKRVNETVEPLLKPLDGAASKTPKSKKSRSAKSKRRVVKEGKTKTKSKTKKDKTSSRNKSRESKGKGKGKNKEGGRRRAAGDSLSPPPAYRSSVSRSALQLELPPLTFAHWLSVDFQLIWLGSGRDQNEVRTDGDTDATGDAGSAEEARRSNPVDAGSTEEARRSNPVGKLHFDRQENLMMMVTGSKRFTLYDPAQSTALYADMPVRQGSLQVAFNRTSGEAVFTREARPPFFVDVKLDVHAYSPLDIRAERRRLARGESLSWPLFRDAVSTDCTVNKVGVRVRVVGVVWVSLSVSVCVHVCGLIHCYVVGWCGVGVTVCVCVRACMWAYTLLCGGLVWCGCHCLCLCACMYVGLYIVMWWVGVVWVSLSVSVCVHVFGLIHCYVVGWVGVDVTVCRGTFCTSRVTGGTKSSP